MKPADFFIGVMEFFAILMPGSVLVYLLIVLAPQQAAALVAPLGTSSEVVKWSAFAVAAYVSGHLLHHIGSVLDGWYDNGFVKHKRRFGEERLLRDARDLVRTELGGNLEGISTFEWAGSWVRAHSDSAGAELERSGADSKFFRSLCIVAAIAVPVFLFRGAVFTALAFFALSWFSYRRFCKRRWDTTQRTYEYFVMLYREKASMRTGSGDEPAPVRTTARG